MGHAEVEPVRSRTVMMIVMALVFGSMAVLAGQKWLEGQASRQRGEPQVVQRAEPMATIVVAALPLKFGTEITAQHLREIPWAQAALPKGAFAKVTDILDGKGKRVALAAMEENEPVLQPKVTGSGQRASLAAVIEDGMKAVTIRVNDVNGVAGFVLPGERVDVLLIRTAEKGEAYADVILQNLRVLAADQSADERSDKPAVVKAVTLEANTEQAQRLTLAATVGTLSLALRAAGANDFEASRRIGVADLVQGGPALPPADFASMTPEPRPANTVVGVTRAMKRQDYNVPTFSGPETPDVGTASVVNR